MHGSRTRAGGGPGRPALALVAGLTTVLLVPAAAAAHADLVSSSPADNAIIIAPYDGPIVLTFSEPLAEGSKAELFGAGLPICNGCAALPDPDHPNQISFGLEGALEPGDYTIQWTSVAEDGDVERGIVHFTVVLPPPTATPPDATRSLAPTNGPTATPIPTARASEPSASSAPSAESDGGAGGGADVLLPIAVVGLLIGGGLAFLLRRRGAG